MPHLRTPKQSQDPELRDTGYNRGCCSNWGSNVLRWLQCTRSALRLRLRHGKRPLKRTLSALQSRLPIGSLLKSKCACSALHTSLPNRKARPLKCTQAPRARRPNVRAAWLRQLFAWAAVWLCGYGCRCRCRCRCPFGHRRRRCCRCGRLAFSSSWAPSFAGQRTRKATGRRPVSATCSHNY